MAYLDENSREFYKEIKEINKNLSKISRSGGSGTNDYNELENQPSINGHILTGNKTASQLGINIEQYDDSELREHIDAIEEDIGEISQQLAGINTEGSSEGGNLEPYTIECDNFINLDGHLVPDVNYEDLVEAINAGVIGNNRVLCVSNVNAGDFYSIDLSVLEGTDYYFTFKYADMGIFQYITELKDSVEVKFIPFKQPSIVGCYDASNDRFYEDIMMEDEIEPKDKELYIDITNVSAPTTYICFTSGNSYTYKRLQSSELRYMGENGVMYITGKDFPSMLKSTAQEIYDNIKNGVDQTLYWINKDGVEHYFKVICMSDYDIGNTHGYMMQILYEGAYNCIFSWTDADEEDYLAPSYTENLKKEITYSIDLTSNDNEIPTAKAVRDYITEYVNSKIH